MESCALPWVTHSLATCSFHAIVPWRPSAANCGWWGYACQRVTALRGAAATIHPSFLSSAGCGLCEGVAAVMGGAAGSRV
eukprot:1160473-Pelagomonas_calceolata.AAC.2